MANESAILWVDVDNNTLLTGWESSTPAQRPSFKQGDNIKVEMHFVKRVSTNTGIFFDEVPTAGSSFRLAVGNPDAVPTGGTWTLDFDGEQADFLYNASAASVQTALNAFASITALGGVTVEKVNGDTTYRISFNSKVALPDGFSSDGTNLLPSSTVVIDEIKVGSPTVRGVWQVKPTQVPIAYQYVWTAQTQSVISTSTLQSGTTRVKIEPAPKDGTFTLSVGSTNTAPISVYATTLDVENAITSAGVDGFEVKKSGAFIWDVTQTTTPLVSVTANGSGLISFDAIVGEVNFNNYETATLLAGASSKATTLEIEVTTGSSVATVLQTPVVIVANLINETIFAPTPFEERVSQSDLATGLAGKYDVTNPAGYIPDAPNDNNQYARQNNQWQVVEANPDLSGYALLSGATFTGKVTGTTSAASSAFNIGTVTAAPTTLVNGDIWITDRLAWQNRNGNIITALTNNQTNTIVTSSNTAFILGITQNGNGGGLKVTNNGTGESLRIEDGSENPDLTPFIVGADGRVGIHGSPANNTAHKLAIYNGNVVFSAGYGIAFGDGTTQTTAATTPNLSGYALLSGATFTGEVKSLTSLVMPQAEYTPTSVTQGQIWHDGTGNIRVGTYTDTAETLVTGSQFTSTLAQYATLTNPIFIGDPRAPTPATADNDTSIATTAFVKNQNYITSSALTGYALLSGATFTGKVNHTSVGGAAGVNIGIGGTSTNAVAAGDLWISTGGTNLNFRDGGGAWRVVATQGQTNSFSTNQIISGSTTSAMLRVTQTGTGEALRIEDESPETTPFVVGSDGRVGIHGTPSTTATNKLAIYDGNISFTSGFGLAFGDGTTQTTAATGNVSTGVTNTFTTNQIIAGTTTNPTLRITQSGTGDALRVQDVANDTSAFVIDKDGLVGINGEPHGATNFPLTINNGDLRFVGLTGGAVVSGITFTDGSRLSSAAGVGATTFFGMTDVDWDSSFATPDTDGSFPVIRVNPTTGAKVVEFVPSYYWNGIVGMPPHISTTGYNSGDPSTSYTITMTVNFLKPILALHTGLIWVQLVSSPNTHIYANRTTPYYGSYGAYYGKELGIRINQYDTVHGWTYYDPEGCFYVSVESFDGSGSPTTFSWADQFASSSVLLGGEYRAYVEQTTSPYYDRPVTERGFQNALTLFLLQQNALPEPTATPRKLALTLDEASQLWSMTPRNVFTEKVSLPSVTTTSASLNIGAGSVNPTNPFAGDIWLNGDTLFYRAGSSNLEVALRNTNNVYTGTQTIDLSSASTAVRITQRGTGSALVVEDSTTPDSTAFIVNASGQVGIQRANGWSPSAGVFLDVGGKGLFTATATFAGLNIGVQTTAPTTTQAGDVWVGTNNIFFKDSTNAQRTVPALNLANVFAANQVVAAATTGALLRITQTGTGNALVVEDTNNPDTTSLVVNNAGNVGVGVNPSSWLPTNKVEVEGAIKADSITFDGTAQFKVNAVQSHTGGADTHELLISYNGSTYKVGMTLVSTP